MPTAVVYYSFSGTCTLAARAAADKLGAVLVELKEKKARPEKINYAAMGFQAMFGVSTALSGDPWAQVAAADTLLVLTPVWAGMLTPAVRRFLKKADLKGKRVTVYAVMADPALNVDKVAAAAGKLVVKAGGTLTATKGLLGTAPGKPLRQEAAADMLSLL